MPSSSSRVSATEAARHYSAHQRRALELIERYEGLLDRTRTAEQDARGERSAALHALAVAYLPRLDRAALDRAERLTGFRGFSRRDPLQAMAHEEQVLRKTVARVLGDERYQRRQYLVGEQGELTRERAEAASMREPWAAECDKVEALDGFLELVESGYDTPDFALSFWQAEYWRQWKQGDEICEALGVADFGDDVLPAYRKAAAERARWDQELARVDARIDAVHELVRTHDQSLARLPRLPAETLAGCHKVLATHLEHADPALLDEWLQAEPAEHRPVRLALRRVAGLGAKLDALSEISRHGLTDFIAAMRERSGKYGRKISKFQRPKYISSGIPAGWLDPRFEDKARKYDARSRKIETLLDRIDRYDDYQRFDLANPPELWWVEMTGKKPSSSLTPRLRRWYDQHPDVAPAIDVDGDLEEDPAAAVAAAAAARELDDIGYLS